MRSSLVAGPSDRLAMGPATHPEGWFARMDDPTHLRAGIANVRLPGDGASNILLVHSGWGDGAFPIYSEVDDDALFAVHIDFGIFPPRVHQR